MFPVAKRKQALIYFGLSIAALFLSAQMPDSTPSQYRKGLVGFTYTQDHIFISLAQGSDIANIHLYGWGALWPFAEGEKGEFDNGESIDERIQQATADGQEVMLTCAVAPSNYRASAQPWNMEERVLPEHEDRYAQRCAEAVQRWPQITRVQVWNELKGYWSEPKNRWDHEGYTRFYNKVYSAVKAVRPDVLVGGGYAVMSALGRGFDREYAGVTVDYRGMEAMLYWLKHAKGFDAICLDGQHTPEDFIALTHYFRILAPNKPIWWSEYYATSLDNMYAARNAIAHNQREGDISLWWAASAFPWGDYPR